MAISIVDKMGNEIPVAGGFGGMSADIYDPQGKKRDIFLPATATAAGLMAPEDKIKVDSLPDYAYSIGTDRIDIPEGADLNTYTTVGNYKCKNNVTAATIINCPASIAFCLTVESPNGRSLDGNLPWVNLLQTVKTLTGQIYVRMFATGSTAADYEFGEWRMAYDTTNLLPSTATTAGLMAPEDKARLDVIPNPNLLDNADFRQIINQRGEESYAVNGYTVDRWANHLCNVALDGRGINLSVRSAGWADFGQIACPERIIAGRPMIASMVTKTDHADSFVVGVRTSSAGIINNTVIASGSGYSLASIPIVIDNPNDVGSVRMVVGVSRDTVPAGSNISLLAAKLEYGDRQTLAKTNAAGNLVLDANGDPILLDPPPDPTLELLKCQRYLQVFRTEALRPTYAEDFRPVMRADPTLGTYTRSDGVTLYTASAEL